METPPPQPKFDERRAVLRTAGPLCLVVGGSGIAPLPCAFSLAGIPAGIVVVILVALINDYTSIMLVQAAVATRKYGYEEVMAAVGGRVAQNGARAALVVLLFGTMCGSLSVILETGLRASEAAGWTAIHDTDGGRLALLAGLTWLVLFPLSLAGLGEMDVVSIFGAVMVVILSGYTVYVAAASGHGISPSEIELKWSTLPESLSELGFAFWLQARKFGAIRRNSAQFCAISLTQFSDALLPLLRSRVCCRCCASSPRARSASAS